jgi:hypothetical protein
VSPTIILLIESNKGKNFRNLWMYPKCHSSNFEPRLMFPVGSWSAQIFSCDCLALWLDRGAVEKMSLMLFGQVSSGYSVFD